MMGEMETQRVEEQENYWLIQYQKLLDSKPKGLEEAEGSMDPKVTVMLMMVVVMVEGKCMGLKRGGGEQTPTSAP